MRMTELPADITEHKRKKRPLSWKNLVWTTELVSYNVVLPKDIFCCKED